MLLYPTPLLLSESLPRQLAPTVGHGVYRAMMQMVFSSIAGNRLISAGDPSFLGMISRDQTITATNFDYWSPGHHTKYSSSYKRIRELLISTYPLYNQTLQ